MGMMMVVMQVCAMLASAQLSGREYSTRTESGNYTRSAESPGCCSQATGTLRDKVMNDGQTGIIPCQTWLVGMSPRW